MSNTWLKKAKCRGLPGDEIKDFYSFEPEAIERAKAICATCPVKAPCIEYVGENNAIAGGMTKFERLLEVWHRVESEEESNFS